MKAFARCSFGLAICVQVALSSLGHAVDGELDPDFGTGGVVVTSPASNDSAMGLAIGGDGRIVVGGDAGFGYAIVRLLADGSIDPDFGDGGDGTRTGMFGTLFNNVVGVAITPTGKVLLGGSFFDQTPNLSHRDFTMARYLGDGSPDTTYGDGSFEDADHQRRFEIVGDRSNDTTRGMSVAADGKVLLCGSSEEVGYSVLRFLPDGSPDPTFSADSIPVGTTNFVPAFAAGQQSDGKVVLAGDFRVDNTTSGFGVVRLLNNGDRDTSFAGDGILESNFESTIRAMVVLPDNRIVLGGSIGSNVYLIRLAPDGAPDPSFGTGGAVAFNFGNNDLCEAMVLQPDGKIIFVGTSERIGVHRLIGARINADGSLDPTFAGGGAINYQHDGINTLGHAIALAPDGGIVIAGATGPGSAKDFLIMRLQNGTAPPITLADWRQQHFGSPDDTGSGANDADLDHDGVPNLVEFAFGLDPNRPDAPGLPQPLLGDGAFGVSFAVPAGIDASEIVYGAEWSTRLTEGSWSAITDTGSVSVHGFSVATDGRPAMFVRLTVAPAP